MVEEVDSSSLSDTHTNFLSIPGLGKDDEERPVRAGYPEALGVSGLAPVLAVPTSGKLGPSTRRPPLCSAVPHRVLRRQALGAHGPPTNRLLCPSCQLHPIELPQLMHL